VPLSCFSALYTFQELVSDTLFNTAAQHQQNDRGNAPAANSAQTHVPRSMVRARTAGRRGKCRRARPCCYNERTAGLPGALLRCRSALMPETAAPTCAAPQPRRPGMSNTRARCSRTRSARARRNDTVRGTSAQPGTGEHRQTQTMRRSNHVYCVPSFRLGSESNFLEETMNITDMVKRKFDSDPNLLNMPHRWAACT